MTRQAKRLARSGALMDDIEFSNFMLIFIFRLAKSDRGDAHDPQLDESRRTDETCK